MSSISMLNNLGRTRSEIAPFIIRVVLGVVMFAHGAQKLLGWFGGHGPSWTVEKWGQWFNMPPFITWLVIMGEFLGPLFLLVGFLSRFMAAVIAVIMLGAIYFVHFRWGFYMNWYSEQERGEGFEYHLLVLGICLALMISGSGKWSIDRRIFNQ
jgi:putative oxidoreductase